MNYFSTRETHRFIIQIEEEETVIYFINEIEVFFSLKEKMLKKLMFTNMVERGLKENIESNEFF